MNEKRGKKESMEGGIIFPEVSIIRASLASSQV